MTTAHALDLAQHFHVEMTQALLAHLPRSDASLVGAVVEHVTTVQERARVGVLLKQARARGIARPAVRRQLVQRALAALAEVLGGTPAGLRALRTVRGSCVAHVRALHARLAEAPA